MDLWVYGIHINDKYCTKGDLLIFPFFSNNSKFGLFLIIKEFNITFF